MSYKNKIISGTLVILILISFILPITTLAEEDINNDYLLTDELKKLFSEGGVDIGTVKKESYLSSFLDGSVNKYGFPQPSMGVFKYKEINSGETSVDNLANVFEKYPDYKKTVAPILFFDIKDELDLLEGSNNSSYRELSVLNKSTSDELEKYLSKNNETIDKYSINYLNPNINRALFAKIQASRFLISGTGGISATDKTGISIDELNERSHGLMTAERGIFYVVNSGLELDGLNKILDKFKKMYNNNYSNTLEDKLKIEQYNVKFDWWYTEKFVNFRKTNSRDKSDLKDVTEYAFPEDTEKLAAIPFDTIFGDNRDLWNSKEGKAIREMLIERLRLIYALVNTIESNFGKKNEQLLNIIMDSANKYMQLRKDFDNYDPPKIEEDFYGLEYELSIGDTGSLESKEESGETLSKQQKEEVSEALDKYPGIWDPAIGFTPEYKGLFAWTSAFTPFKTNIFDGNNRKNLNKEELSLLDSYGANRSVLYVAQGDHGVLRNIEENSNSIDFSMISLAEFIQKASKSEIALFVRHETTKLVMDTDNTIEEITGVSKTPKSDQEAKEINDNIQIRKEDGKEGESLEQSSDKTPVSDIQEEVGAYKIGGKETTVFLGPFYTSSGQYGKDLVSLVDASETRYLKGEAWSKDTFFSFIADQLLANGVEKSEVTDRKSVV